MPTIRFSAISLKEICSISKNMTDDLENFLQCPRDYLTLEVAQSTFIRDGKVTEGYPIIEVLWFDRGQEIQDKTAKIITAHVQSLGYGDVDLFFTVLEKNRYYENGEHF